MKNKAFEPIYKRYLKEALGVDKAGRKILKADCSNEFHGHPKSGCFCLVMGGIAPLMEADVTLLEIDKTLVRKTQALYPDLNIVMGDIRDIPFSDRVFDTVLDLSTLDHVPFKDGDKVLKEYSRVLKNGGNMVLAVWTVNGNKNYNHNNGDVYYFAKNPLRKNILKYFTIVKEENIFEQPGPQYLTLWRVNKIDIPEEKEQ